MGGSARSGENDPGVGEGQALGGAEITWEPLVTSRPLMGTIKLSGRIQPFSLVLRSLGSHPVVRCISPIGLTDTEGNAGMIQDRAMRLGVRLGAIEPLSAFREDLEKDILGGI